MSGFGGNQNFGFGQPANSNTFGFGASNNVGFSAAQGGIDGSPSTAVFFGSSLPTGNAGSTFGASPSSGVSFGSVNTQNPFGQSQPQGSAATPPFGVGTGTMPSSSGTLFGASPNVVTTSSSSPGFGNMVGSSSFFNTNQPQPNNLFSSGNNNTFSAPFGVGPQTTTTSSNVASPFGAPTNASSASSLSFGVSANVVRTHQNQGSFSSTTGWGSTNNPQSSSGFGTLPFGKDAMARDDSNDDDGMQQESEDDPDGTRSPFGQTQTFSRSQGSNSLNPISEGDSASFMDDPVEVDNGSGVSNNNNDEEEKRLKEKMDQKRLLQAQIEEKKRKLLERKNKRSQAKDSPLNPSASPFTPASSASSGKAAERSLAERNAIRFGDKKNDPSAQSLLPADMRDKADSASNNVDSGGSTSPLLDNKDDREDIRYAVSLVGTCPYMCPDDELIRRDRENDIQQLEIPLPGTLHPSHWTLRNTAVKRFRRSAADYKLDVPEWVRPPDVLETVCGFLEEWVMERDRQGPDPRFPNGQPPPSLDVYQFIWDRTRMIRKDFTLQNYVGTGGNCDARAVRCHERIARWHAMCEHQLSHILEFRTMQSQQNIQELGQTMKTLNQFYDDSMNRSVIEVPDEKGNETRLNPNDFSRGCTSDRVQGKDPVDFNGDPLNNAGDPSLISKRLIGSHSVKQTSSGTAEPEMRGLYILLTMNNDGGMEVLKYAAKLFKERPAVYQSRPVQLALSIYKAKKEYNYARFFALLRSPETPYLFCCVMFKHVELMRKIAFRIMSKTYGARKKDTGESVYDSYELSRLTELLCFEDLDEAREACKHYNITVRQMKMSSSSSQTADVIFWRHSDFKEPVHPEKGTIIPLLPRKMTRTIERKLNGATRLAVCRGEVSGEGAALSKRDSPAKTVTFNMTLQPPSEAQVQRNAELAAQADAFRLEQAMERRRVEEERERMKQELQKAKAEESRQAHERERREEQKEKERRENEAEAKRQAEVAAQRKREKMQEMELRLQQEKARLEEIRARKEAEKARKAEEQRLKFEAENRRLQMEEEARMRAEREKKEAEERLERERLAETERKRKVEEERRKKEAEERRSEILRREAARRRAKEAEEHRKLREWMEQSDTARRIIIWRRWRRRLARSMEMMKGVQDGLMLVDPTFERDTFKFGHSLRGAILKSILPARNEVVVSDASPRRVLESCLREDRPKLSISDMAMGELASLHFLETSRSHNEKLLFSKSTLLFKIGIIIPYSNSTGDEAMFELIASWLHSRLDVGKLVSSVIKDNRGQITSEVRSVTVICKSFEQGLDCDVALFLIPPPLSSIVEWSKELQLISSVVDADVHRVVLVLDDIVNGTSYDYRNDMLGSLLGGSTETLSVNYSGSVSVGAYESALETACRKLCGAFVQESCIRFHRISVMELASAAIRDMFWRDFSSGVLRDENQIPGFSKIILLALVDEADEQLKQNKALWSAWPPREFHSKNGGVERFFSEEEALPKMWADSLRRERLGAAIADLSEMLNGSFRVVVDKLLFSAPASVREDCMGSIAKNHFRRCFDKVLSWVSDPAFSAGKGCQFVYFPSGFLELLFQGIIVRLKGQFDRHEDTENLFQGQQYKFTYTSSPESAGALGSIDSIMNQTEKNHYSLELAVYTKHVEDKSNAKKRPRLDACTPENNNALSIEQPVEVDTGKRKRESSTPSQKSRDLMESAEFSKKLESLVHGAIVDFMVGNVLISDILRDAKPIKLLGVGDR